jgi:beta-phosphoglucomutase-like phosphatase (HAD superfamily)
MMHVGAEAPPTRSIIRNPLEPPLSQIRFSQGVYPRGVLFDLDGTLLDSAPDMVEAINILRRERGEPDMPHELLRPHVSKGARAMIGASFVHLDHEAREALVKPFLDAYEGIIGRYCVLFDGIAEMLEALEADGVRWGIVTAATLCPNASRIRCRCCIRPKFLASLQKTACTSATTNATSLPRVRPACRRSSRCGVIVCPAWIRWTGKAM